MSSRTPSRSQIIIFLAMIAAPFWRQRAGANPEPAIRPRNLQRARRDQHCHGHGGYGRGSGSHGCAPAGRGFGGSDLQVFTPAPRKGNLVARIHGTGARNRILLMATN